MDTTQLSQKSEPPLRIPRVPGTGTTSLQKHMLSPNLSTEPVHVVYVPMLTPSRAVDLYLGDIVICARERALFPDITVQEGIRIFLTGGVALPPNVKL